MGRALADRLELVSVFEVYLAEQMGRLSHSELPEATPPPAPPQRARVPDRAETLGPSAATGGSGPARGGAGGPGRALRPRKASPPRRGGCSPRSGPSLRARSSASRDCSRCSRRWTSFLRPRSTRQLFRAWQRLDRLVQLRPRLQSPGGGHRRGGAGRAGAALGGHRGADAVAVHPLQPAGRRAAGQLRRLPRPAAPGVRLLRRHLRRGPRRGGVRLPGAGPQRGEASSTGAAAEQLGSGPDPGGDPAVSRRGDGPGGRAARPASLGEGLDHRRRARPGRARRHAGEHRPGRGAARHGRSGAGWDRRWIRALSARWAS